MSDPPTLFDQAGGEPVLRAAMQTFFDRVFADIMIGFHFHSADKAHLIEREYELAARFLGAPDVRYTGRPLREAHAPHPILGGQFERRLVLLDEALRAHAVPEHVRAALLEHNRSLRHLITPNEGSQCIHPPDEGASGGSRRRSSAEAAEE